MLGHTIFEWRSLTFTLTPLSVPYGRYSLSDGHISRGLCDDYISLGSPSKICPCGGGRVGGKEHHPLEGPEKQFARGHKARECPGLPTSSQRLPVLPQSFYFVKEERYILAHSFRGSFPVALVIGVS